MFKSAAHGPLFLIPSEKGRKALGIRLLFLPAAVSQLRMALHTRYSASWLLSLILVLFVVVPTRALYFYMEGSSSKCFFEELPKDTLVVGMRRRLPQLCILVIIV